MTASSSRGQDTELDIAVVHGDITEQAVDVVVNAANSALLGGGGVDGAIHRRGGPAILAACRDLRASSHPDGLPPGAAAATTAGALPARWVIHTVGPVYSSAQDRSALLASCYRESVRLAAELGAVTMAFPAISTGAYRWPWQQAARIALRTVAECAPGAVRHIRFVLFDADILDVFRTELAALRSPAGQSDSRAIGQ